MSRVTNLIITASTGEEEAISYLRQEFPGPPEGGGGDFSNLAIVPEVQPFIAGTKTPEASILLGAFNKFDEKRFLESVRQAPWIYPESVRVFWQRDGETCFGLCEVAQIQTGHIGVGMHNS